MNTHQKEPFKLTLSVSTKTAKSKAEAGKITEFEKKENIHLSTGSLANLFTSHLQSTNLWNKTCSKDNYLGMTGVMLDFDHNVTIPEIKQRCHDWHFILYTSTNHRTNSEDRFRVILPLDPESYPASTLHQKVYESVVKEFPEIDKSCTTTASKFFPFCGDDMTNFSVEIHDGKDYWTPDFSYIDLNVKGVPTFKLDTVVLNEMKQPIMIKDIKEKTRIFCPFNNPEERTNPERHNAAVFLNDGIPLIYCSSCESKGLGLGKLGVYELEPNTAFELAVQNRGTIVFRDIITDKYFLGEMSKSQGRYVFNAISKQNIRNALETRDIPFPDHFPEMEFYPDFSSDQIVDIENGFVNRYIAPDVLRKTVAPGAGQTIPMHTRLLTRHICGYDQDVFDLLINHLAYMVQKRIKTRVAFLFQGTQGTGKGAWFNNVLAPIFGEDYCTAMLQKAFVKEFNTFLENKFCILIDEVEANFSETNNEITRTLKQVITDTNISVEGKGLDIRNGRNNANIFFATNKRNGINIEPGDRRFIVAPRQEKKVYDMCWWVDDEIMIERLKGESEEFVAYLKQYSVDMSKVNHPFDNPAKEALIDLSKTNADYIFEAVKEGNWQWLKDNIVHDSGPYSDVHKTLDLIKHVDRVSREDLNDIYNNINGKSINPASFTRLCKLHGLEIKQMKIGGINKQGVQVNWKLPDLTEE